MGEVVLVETNRIIPSQDFLKKGTVKHILRLISENKWDELPPAPIVRKEVNNRGRYIAIDGHNLIAVYDFLGRDIEVYVADSENDILDNADDLEAIKKRNQDLKNKFSQVVDNKKDYSFSDLRYRYDFLK